MTEELPFDTVEENEPQQKQEDTISALPEEPHLLPEVSKVLSIVDLAKEHIPKLALASHQAVSTMQEFPEELTSEEEREDAMEVGGLVADAYDKVVARRKLMTAPLDELKDFLMQYERPLDAKNENSEYAKLRRKIGKFDQKKIDEKKRVEAEAAKKKAKANALSDMGTAVLQNLNDLILRKTREAEVNSKKYFEASTLENFDVRADNYKKMKPSLKPEDYAACFNVPYNNQLFTLDEATDFVATMKKVEPYEKWVEEIVKAATPVLNAWRSKIPELKENLVKLKQAKDDDERKRLSEQQAAKAKEEEDRRLQDIQQNHVAASSDIQSRGELDKLSNSFAEQASIQSVDDTGPVKIVLKFTDKDKIGKNFMTIIAHVLAHKDFPGIFKKDKAGKVVNDADGNPEFATHTKWWIDYFTKNCDVAIEGVEFFEKAKTIIRK